MATTRIVKYIEIGPKNYRMTQIFLQNQHLKDVCFKDENYINFKLVEMSLSIFHKAVASVVPSPS